MTLINAEKFNNLVDYLRFISYHPFERGRCVVVLSDTATPEHHEPRAQQGGMAVSQAQM